MASPAPRPSTREREWTAPAAATTAVAVVRPTAGPQGAARGTAEEAVDPHAAGGAGDDALLGGPGADAFVFVGGNDTLLDFTNGQDRIWLEADLWGGTPPPVSRLLAGATLTDTGIILTLGFGATLDIRGIFDTRLLMDDFQFI